MWWFECRFRHFCFLLPVIHSLINPLKQSKIFFVCLFFVCQGLVKSKIQSTPAKPSRTKPACFFLENVSCCLAISLFVYHFFGSFTFEVLCGCAWKLLQFTSMHLIQQGFYSGLSSVPCDSYIVILSNFKKKSSTLLWRKLIWICMVSIIYLMVYVVCYTLVCIATCSLLQVLFVLG